MRADDIAAVVSDPDSSLAAATNGPFVERGESYAQLVTANGSVIQFTHPLGPAPVLSRGEVRRALKGSFFGDRPQGTASTSRRASSPYR